MAKKEEPQDEALDRLHRLANDFTSGRAEGNVQAAVEKRLGDLGDEHLALALYHLSGMEVWDVENGKYRMDMVAAQDYLLGRGADPSMALARCVDAGWVDTVEAMIRSGVDIKRANFQQEIVANDTPGDGRGLVEQNFSGLSAAHILAQRPSVEHIGMIAVLDREGVSLRGKSSESAAEAKWRGLSPIEIAALEDSASFLRELAALLRSGPKTKANKGDYEIFGIPASPGGMEAFAQSIQWQSQRQPGADLRELGLSGAFGAFSERALSEAADVAIVIGRERKKAILEPGIGAQAETLLKAGAMPTALSMGDIALGDWAKDAPRGASLPELAAAKGWWGLARAAISAKGAEELLEGKAFLSVEGEPVGIHALSSADPGAEAFAREYFGKWIEAGALSGAETVELWASKAGDPAWGPLLSESAKKADAASLGAIVQGLALAQGSLPEAGKEAFRAFAAAGGDFLADLGDGKTLVDHLLSKGEGLADEAIADAIRQGGQRSADKALLAALRSRDAGALHSALSLGALGAGGEFLEEAAAWMAERPSDGAAQLAWGSLREGKNPAEPSGPGKPSALEILALSGSEAALGILSSERASGVLSEEALGRALSRLAGSSPEKAPSAAETARWLMGMNPAPRKETLDRFAEEVLGALGMASPAENANPIDKAFGRMALFAARAGSSLPSLKGVNLWRINLALPASEASEIAMAHLLGNSASREIDSEIPEESIRPEGLADLVRTGGAERARELMAKADLSGKPEEFAKIESALEAADEALILDTFRAARALRKGDAAGLSEALARSPGARKGLSAGDFDIREALRAAKDGRVGEVAALREAGLGLARAPQALGLEALDEAILRKDFAMASEALSAAIEAGAPSLEAKARALGLAASEWGLAGAMALSEAAKPTAELVAKIPASLPMDSEAADWLVLEALSDCKSSGFWAWMGHAAGRRIGDLSEGAKARVAQGMLKEAPPTEIRAADISAWAASEEEKIQAGPRSESPASEKRRKLEEEKSRIEKQKMDLEQAKLEMELDAEIFRALLDSGVDPKESSKPVIKEEPARATAKAKVFSARHLEGFDWGAARPEALAAFGPVALGAAWADGEAAFGVVAEKARGEELAEAAAKLARENPALSDANAGLAGRQRALASLILEKDWGSDALGARALESAATLAIRAGDRDLLAKAVDPTLGRKIGAKALDAAVASGAGWALEEILDAGASPASDRELMKKMAALAPGGERERGSLRMASDFFGRLMRDELLEMFSRGPVEDSGNRIGDLSVIWAAEAALIRSISGSASAKADPEAGKGLDAALEAAAEALAEHPRLLEFAGPLCRRNARLAEAVASADPASLAFAGVRARGDLRVALAAMRKDPKEAILSIHPALVEELRLKDEDPVAKIEKALEPSMLSKFSRLMGKSPAEKALEAVEREAAAADIEEARKLSVDFEPALEALALLGESGKGDPAARAAKRALGRARALLRSPERLNEGELVEVKLRVSDVIPKTLRSYESLPEPERDRPSPGRVSSPREEVVAGLEAIAERFGRIRENALERAKAEASRGALVAGMSDLESFGAKVDTVGASLTAEEIEKEVEHAKSLRRIEDMGTRLAERKQASQESSERIRAASEDIKETMEALEENLRDSPALAEKLAKMRSASAAPIPAGGGAGSTGPG